MQIDITAIIVAVIGLIGAIITSQLIPWLKARTTSEQWAAIEVWAQAAVKAAEVLYGAGEGDIKLDYALMHVGGLCASAGFKVDAEKLRAVIEQTWLDLTNCGAINQVEVDDEPTD